MSNTERTTTVHVRQFPVDLWLRFRGEALKRGQTARALLVDVLRLYLQGGVRMSDRADVRDALTAAIEALEGCEEASERRAMRGKGMAVSETIAECLGKLFGAREALK